MFNSQELQIMDLALAEVLAIVDELGLNHDGLEEKLRQHLFVVAGHGVGDPRVLQNKLLETIDFSVPDA